MVRIIMASLLAIIITLFSEAIFDMSKGTASENSMTAIIENNMSSDVNLSLYRSICSKKSEPITAINLTLIQGTPYLVAFINGQSFTAKTKYIYKRYVAVQENGMIIRLDDELQWFEIENKHGTKRRVSLNNCMKY